MSLNSYSYSAASCTGRLSLPWHLAVLSLSLASMALLSGCGSGTATRAGEIAVTYPGGVPPGQLPVLNTATLSMMPASDPADLGVDWTLTCGGSAQAGYVTTRCGTLVPAHTADGAPATYTAPGMIPADNTIAITARVSSDPSQHASVTITIVNPLISVATPTAPASLPVGGTAAVSAAITNDVNTLGESWTASCGAADCGSFNPTRTLSGAATTYTAPAAAPQGGTVTLTATSEGDATRSASVAITILPIAVSVSPSAFLVTTSGTETLTAAVTNDVKGAGVTWSCGSGGCGTFDPVQTTSGASTTYTAPAAVPSGGAVTITATSASDGTTSAAGVATVTTAPVISVTMSRMVPASLAEGKSATLGATVTGDPTGAGVDWTASCGTAAPGACGAFSPAATGSGTTTTYTAPSSLPPAPVIITATSHAYNLDPSLLANSATASTTITASPSIALTQQPSASVTANGQTSVSATVANDATPGGVTWTVTCAASATGGCGYVRPYQTASGATATYVAPPASPGTPVQIVATSTAFPAVSTASAPVTIVPSTVHSIAFVPFAPSALLLGSTVTLNAAVTNDPSQSGVDWAVCSSGCGFFTIRPATPAVPAVPPGPGDPGSPYVPPVPAVTATSVEAWPSGLPIPYTAPAAAPEEGAIVITAAATADRLNDVSPPATAVASIVLTTEPAGPELHGIVQAGTQPVAGASVYLYAASAAGYASQSLPVYNPSTAASATTDSSGGFTLPAGYACPSLTSQVYLVALGGQAGTGAPNPNLALMTALGPCSNLGTTPVVINEITTVASATALATFSADNVQTGQLSYLYIGSGGDNATVGLANAFAAASNLVDVTTGQPRFWTVAGNAAVPYAQINTLADALNACAVTAGGSAGDGTPCGDLFSYTDPLGEAYPGLAPTDTLQAAFDLVRSPSPGVVENELAPASVFATASPASPWQPIQTSVPSEWSVALTYTSGGGVGGSGATASGSSALAIDASGNVWIANRSINSVSEWSPLGAPYSPNTAGTIPGGFTGGGINAPAALAIDPDGYVWLANGDGTLSRLDLTGTADANSPFSGGGLSAPAGMAIDGDGFIWVTNGGSPGDVARFNGRGIALSPATGYTEGMNDPLAVAVDGSGNVWIQNENPATGAEGTTELNGASGSIIASSTGTGLAGDGVHPQVAADASGNIWRPSYCGFTEVSPDTALPGTLVTTATETLDTLGGTSAVAIDGADRLWVAAAGGYNCASIANVPPSLVLTTTGVNGYALVNQSLANTPQFMAIDASGDLWILLGDNTVTEFIGAATPAVTPLAAAVRERRLGAEP